MPHCDCNSESGITVLYYHKLCKDSVYSARPVYTKQLLYFPAVIVTGTAQIHEPHSMFLNGKDMLITQRGRQ